MTISRKKSISLVLVLILLLIIAVVVVQLLSKKANPVGNNTFEIKSAPAVITADERQELGIGGNVQLEVINRDDDGEITTYRLIK